MCESHCVMPGPIKRVSMSAKLLCAKQYLWLCSSSSADRIWRDQFSNICVCVAWGPQSECQSSESAKSLGKTAIVALWSLFAALWVTIEMLVCVLVSISSTGLQKPLYPFPRGKIGVQISRISFLRLLPRA